MGSFRGSAMENLYHGTDIESYPVESDNFSLYRRSLDTMRARSLKPKYTPPMIDLEEANKDDSKTNDIKCMICDVKRGDAFVWCAKRGIEEGKMRVMCLDCQFESIDKKYIEKTAKADECVIPEDDDEQDSRHLKKPKIDPLH